MAQSDLVVERKDTTLVVRTQAGRFEVPNTKGNEKIFLIFLRLWQDERGKPRYTYQQIADGFGYKDRRDVNNYWREYWRCGGEFVRYVVRKRKVDEKVVEAVEEEMKRKLWRPLRELCEEVNQRLAREDLTVANLEAALEQIPCSWLRQEVVKKWEEGEFHPKEEVILEEVLGALEEGDRPRRQRAIEWLKGVGVENKEPSIEEVVKPQQWEAVEELLEVDKPMEEISEKTKQMVWAMNLYYWNVPLSRIGRWMGRGKSTIYGWVIGLAVALWAVVGVWIVSRVKARRLQIDEKWLKITKKWRYWFVGVDEETGLPVHGELLATRTKWSCRKFLIKLKGLGIYPAVIYTDKLSGYISEIGKVFSQTKHILCLFHHQQGVTQWVKKHLKGLKEPEAEEVKKQMKQVVQTEDTRTVRRRLEELEALDAEQGFGLGSWIQAVRGNLKRLIPALRRNGYAKTTNQIERFFRAFERFYKTRRGFGSMESAKRELMVFLVVYVFTQQEGTGKAPIESIIPQACRMPLYRLLNDPFGCGMVTLCGASQKLEAGYDVNKLGEMATKPLDKAA